MNRHKYEGAILALLGLIGSSATAMAQDAAQPAQPAPATTGTSEVGLSAGTTTTTTTTPLLDADANAAAATTTTTTTAPPPVMEPPPLPPPVDVVNQTDHERVIGGFGVGVLGSVRLDNLASDGSYTSINAPLLGLRHWMSEGLGLEFGVGVAHHSGTLSNDIVGQSNLDDPTYWGLAAHAGVPLALFHDKHFTFLVLPEANFGFSTWRQADDKNDFGDQGRYGRAWLAEVGARAGAEVQFGFMGLPMLSLTGTVGAHLTYRDSGVNSVDSAGNEVEQGRYTLDLTTANYNDPWDIFTSSISALYYFK